MKILIVEDEAVLRECYRDFFNITGVSYDMASNLSSAYKLLENSGVEYVGAIVDLSISGISAWSGNFSGEMSGLELINYIDKEFPLISLICASAYDMKKSPSIPWKTKFLQKPFNYASLENLLLDINKISLERNNCGIYLNS